MHIQQMAFCKALAESQSKGLHKPVTTLRSTRTESVRQSTLFEPLTRNLERAQDRHSWYFGSKLGGEKQRLADITRPVIIV